VAILKLLFLSSGVVRASTYDNLSRVNSSINPSMEYHRPTKMTKIKRTRLEESANQTGVDSSKRN
jgi:hypothetical protein